MSPRLIRRSLRDELAFLLDSTVDLPADAYDRDTLLMRLEVAFANHVSESFTGPNGDWSIPDTSVEIPDFPEQ